MSYRLSRAAAGALAGLALSLLLATQALAARPDDTGWSEIVSPAGHFLVHYQVPQVSSDDAHAAAANFESAYATEVGGWGFHAPLDDGDGKIDVYIGGSSGSNLGEAHHDDSVADTTSGYVVLSPGSATNLEVAAHELFHLIQYSIYAHGAKFLVEGTAEWAGANVARNTTWLLTYWSAPEQSLDCLSGSDCAPTPEGDLSYSRWLFFNHLSESYGPSIVGEIITRAGRLGAGTDASLDLRAIDDVLGAHGSSLAQEFNSFTAENAGGSSSFPGLATGGHSPRSAASAFTGVSSGASSDVTFSVDHLAADYMTLQSGDTRFSNAGCGAATLHINVTMPSEAQSRPVVADADGTYPLTLDTGGAHTDLPWTTCTGSSALLALPNANRALDGAAFAVHTSLTATPPKQRQGTSAPRIRLALHGRDRSFLRLSVKSSGRGLLEVLIKTRYVRGSFRLHKGVNRLKLRLPSGFPAGRHQVVATAYSTTGTRGATIRRHVRIRFASRAA